MATTASVHRPRIPAVAFIISGALLMLAAVLPLFGLTGFPGLVGVAFLAIAATLVLLTPAVGRAFARASLVAAAIAWILLGLNAFNVLFPAFLVTIAALVAGVAGLVAATVIYTGAELPTRPAVIFLVAATLGLVWLLSAIGTLPLGTTATVVAILFAVALVGTGAVLLIRARSRS